MPLCPSVVPLEMLQVVQLQGGRTFVLKVLKEGTSFRTYM